MNPLRPVALPRPLRRKEREAKNCMKRSSRCANFVQVWNLSKVPSFSIGALEAAGNFPKLQEGPIVKLCSSI